MQINTIKSVKTVYFVRHAKSCWNNNDSDFDRPLKKRGIKDANLVSNYLKNKAIDPDLILCSSANRTRLTADIFIENLALNSVKTEYIKALYDFSGEGLLNVLKSCDNSIDKVLIFGHNYAMTNVVNQLGSTPISNMTTSGFVEIDFNIDRWKDLKKGDTKLIVFPKDLR
ncbi:histidine phosphatase family protein [Lacinutrix neustonica]|uniref:Histidine phosphatase family protein n=1 Tax=Lacinutrix neustonica TaxID=2980107 RepID=A0A9E8MZ02_9FLAO|nr:histidine phosphatase family protein [Lacinutrix neustonica]WAC02849.1 histidine phosphatase family protein [Lacinutrix neustonica]